MHKQKFFFLKNCTNRSCLFYYTGTVVSEVVLTWATGGVALSSSIVAEFYISPNFYTVELI